MFQRNDGQMRLAGVIRNVQFDHRPGSSSNKRVRPLCVERGDVVVDLAAERRRSQRHDRQKPSALVLHRLDEPLDDCDAAVLADGAESLLDSATSAPDSELLRRDLDTVIGEQVGGPALDPSAHSPEEGRHVVSLRRTVVAPR